jgi:C-terminal processing protease CtpA/Prc
MFERLPNGDRLQLVLGDYHTPEGVRLEQEGIAPDEEISWSNSTIRSGNDPVLEAAVSWLTSRMEDVP